uniref:DH domain-containing protein n=1 Tax=Arcella intermedia TaxID=1963864 RepID=A0A6B2LBM9_9EUKA
MMEIVETERDYVEDLRIIMEVYKNPLKESGIITEEQQKSLFANIDDIENLNRTKILSILLFRFDVAQRGGDASWMMKINLGDVFTSLSEHLKQYTEYCANQPKALAMLRDLEKENAEFAKFTKDLMDNDPNVRGLSLLSFIIKPVQRLCKYPLLLRELINNTDPTLAEFKQLQEAAKKVNSTVDYVNEEQRKAELEEEEKTTEMSKIENSIEGGEILDLAADKNRKITRIGDIQRLVKKQKKERQPRKLYLFNNLVVLAKPKKKQGKKGKESKLDWFCKIADVSFIDLADNEASRMIYITFI